MVVGRVGRLCLCVVRMSMGKAHCLFVCALTYVVDTRLVLAARRERARAVAACK